VLAVTLTSAEVRRGLYKREESCSSDEAQIVVKKKSKIHCAAACKEQRGCREYNFDETTKDCSLYRHKTTQDCSLYRRKSLFFEPQPTCSSYKARCYGDLQIVVLLFIIKMFLSSLKEAIETLTLCSVDRDQVVDII